VVVRVANKGATGADDVVIEGKMGGETRELTLDQVGKEEVKSGSVIFPPGAVAPPSYRS
jgi:hypothetical protein